MTTHRDAQIRRNSMDAVSVHLDSPLRIAAPSSAIRRAGPILAVAFALLAGACGGPGPDETRSAGQTSSGSSSSGGSTGLAGLNVSSLAITAGGDLTGTVTLSGGAAGASGGVNVYLSYPRNVLAGPRFVRVANGQESATFTLRSNPYLAAPTSVLLFANTQSPDPNVFLSRSLAVAPASSPPAVARPDVASVSFAPATVSSGATAVGTIALTGPAPAGGAAVWVSNGNDFFNQVADVPAVVVVPAGATQASFPVAAHLSSPVGPTSAALPIAASYFGGPFQGAFLTVVSP